VCERKRQYHLKKKKSTFGLAVCALAFTTTISNVITHLPKSAKWGCGLSIYFNNIYTITFCVALKEPIFSLMVNSRSEDTLVIVAYPIFKELFFSSCNHIVKSIRNKKNKQKKLFY